MSQTIPWPKVYKFVLPRIVVKQSGCWEWQGCTSQGYGLWRVNGKVHGVHRVVYTFIKGTIPRGLVIDHLCRNRVCCNPNHLELVTHKINIQRGIAHIPLSEKDYCRKGLHLFTNDNIYVRTYMNSGIEKRQCRTCFLENQRRYRKEKEHVAK